MITNLDPNAELFLANVDRIQDRIAAASRQVSSGRKIASPSDAPDEIDGLLQLRADQQRNTQLRSNLALAKTHAQAADDALASAIKLMDRARVLAAQGGTGTATDADRKATSEEASALFEQMIACSRTAVQGRYVFSGDDATQPPYAADPASPTGVARIVTAGATLRIQSPAGGSFAAGKTAQEIFDSRNADDTPAADNVVAALHDLQAALAAGDSAAAAQAGAAIDAAAARLNSTEAFYGAVEGRIADADAFAQRYDIELQTQLSEMQDADVVAAALTLSQSNTQLQAAFQMRAAMPHKSLFDFLG
jgi:flagellar hook-associated protein 3 FlgL